MQATCYQKLIILLLIEIIEDFKIIMPKLNKVFNMQATCYQKLIILLLIAKIEDFKIIIII